jgi:hypothetical protein
MHHIDGIFGGSIWHGANYRATLQGPVNAQPQLQWIGGIHAAGRLYAKSRLSAKIRIRLNIWWAAARYPTPVAFARPTGARAR